MGGNTHLEGGVIGSTADASKNRLDTGSLSVVDIENESRAKTSGGGISNPLGSMAGAGLSLLGGTKKNDSTTTHSDISAGTAVVRDGNESALAGLDRTATGFDTDSALSAVDLRKMQERAEVMQLGGQLLFKGVGDLGGYLSQKAETEEGRAIWADGGNGRALLRDMFNSDVDPSELLAGVHSGKCPVVGNGSRGNPIVEFGRPIGVDGTTGQAVTRGQIHYSNNGAHIVPDARK